MLVIDCCAVARATLDMRHIEFQKRCIQLTGTKSYSINEQPTAETGYCCGRNLLVSRGIRAVVFRLVEFVCVLILWWPVCMIVAENLSTFVSLVTRNGFPLYAA